MRSSPRTCRGPAPCFSRWSSSSRRRCTWATRSPAGWRSSTSAATSLSARSPCRCATSAAKSACPARRRRTRRRCGALESAIPGGGHHRVFSLSLVEQATRRALASGALQPIETETILLEDGGVRFIVRAVSSLARKSEARSSAAAADPLGDYEPDLFVADLAPSHYVLLNKFPVVAGHALLVTRRFERQERLLGVEDFGALLACLREVDGLGFYNGGIAAGASQGRKHLQFVPLPLAAKSPDDVPMERLFDDS